MADLVIARAGAIAPVMVRRAAVLLLLLLNLAAGLENSLGRKPPMGYSTWNDLGCKGVTADAVKKVADTLVITGLDQLGYEYVNVDDCWANGRDYQGALAPDPSAFPEGIKAVADYVHAKNLKFGLYTDRGVWTCAAKPGSEGNERLDMNTFASWGVDFLKVDSCNAPEDPRRAIEQYISMRDMLNATGRPIFFAVCGWEPWYAEVGRVIGNSWRVAHDLNGYRELWNTVAINSKLGRYAGPGAWNDPDGLVGSADGSRIKLLPHQSRTQFSLWSIMAAPLLLGANLAQLSQFDLDTYSNAEVIAVDQDELGRQGHILWENCPAQSVQLLVKEAKNYPEPPSCQQLWGRPLLGGDWAVVMVNWATETVRVAVDRTDMDAMGFGGGAHIRDLWRKADLGLHDGTFRAQVRGEGGSQMFRLTPRHFFV